MPLVVLFFSFAFNLIPAQTLFSGAERAKLVEFWNAPGRYKATAPPEAATTGPWQVRLTPEGSLWFHAYQQATGAGKAPPTQDGDASPANAEWETWVNAKLAYDRWKAQTMADALNAAVRGPGGMAELKDQIESPPPPPGVIPVGLLEAVGNPPPFASAVTPQVHTVTFQDNDTYAFPDNVIMRPRYAYYRFSQGTAAYGASLRDMPDRELDGLFADAGLSATEQRIARAVSRLEGGFDAVNTYDTGYVSVGFIQFVTLADGHASLCEVLQREKASRPKEYDRDFRRYGVDVNDEGTIVVVDPSTGAELTGKAAVTKIVEDKRLIAVFQKAGRRSTAFRIAQIQVAKSHYWPAYDGFTVAVGGQTLSGKVCDVVKSEAGMATLFDRKVNRGNIGPFAEAVARVMTDNKLTTLAQAADYEREIVAALTYRADFLADASLGQPRAPSLKSEPEKPGLIQLAMRLANQASKAKPAVPQAGKPGKPAAAAAKPAAPAPPANTVAKTSVKEAAKEPEKVPAAVTTEAPPVSSTDPEGSSSPADPPGGQTPPAPSR
jgi:hypothetical protein